MDIQTYLRQRGGVARTAALHWAGFSRTCVDRALIAGHIARIRRGVYALPQDAGVLGLALQHNALLTCLSAASAYQLWTLDNAGPST